MKRTYDHIMCPNCHNIYEDLIETDFDNETGVSYSICECGFDLDNAVELYTCDECGNLFENVIIIDTECFCENCYENTIKKYLEAK